MRFPPQVILLIEIDKKLPRFSLIKMHFFYLFDGFLGITISPSGWKTSLTPGRCTPLTRLKQRVCAERHMNQLCSLAALKAS